MDQIPLSVYRLTNYCYTYDCIHLMRTTSEEPYSTSADQSPLPPRCLTGIGLIALDWCRVHK